MSAVLSAATVSAVGLTCKAFLNSGLCSIQVNGLKNLRKALESKRNHGIVTVCNHISTLDDPVVWGVLPAHYYLNSRTTRWALGASDIIFTNPHGQTLETFRGKGIYQEAVDTAIQKLNQGHWVHLYGEGKVNQPNTYLRDEDGRAHLPRFKWGVQNSGRIIMEADTPPTVIPMWLTGFDKLMPEGRTFPYKYLPRLGVKLSVTFGEPVPSEVLQSALAVRPVDGDPTAIAEHDHLRGWVRDTAEYVEKDTDISKGKYPEPVYVSLVRQKVTSILHDHVEALGRSVSGPSLDDMPPP
ncbi:hypothetical protein D9613_005410 [Agrocybe pediades]|uniref:Tafazzin family protein n=1 Tax=Agrocybe pediades TaxID=84607 RepID=A0A8H4QZA4_9AGAR|nr:hypothetical protein D9613_005410 [Agrocybe pediades]